MRSSMGPHDYYYRPCSQFPHDIEMDETAVNTNLVDEYEDLRQTIRRFCAEKSSEAEVRRLMETSDGYDPSLWKQMAAQLGLQGIGIGEEYGGSGSNQLALAVVFEEFGRALLCSPYFSTIALASNLLLAIADKSAHEDYLPGIASGETIATVALAEDTGQWDEQSVRMHAIHDGTSWTLSGEKTYVLDGCIADLIFVAARTTSGVCVFAVNKGSQGFSTEPLPTLDLTRKQARLKFQSTPARLVGSNSGEWPAISKMLAIANASLAAEQVGGAQAVLGMAVEYARNRSQFGSIIGSFQAIRHKCAELFISVEAARSAVYYASWAASTGSIELPVSASLAKAICSEAYFRIAAENIQIHGGIGFTWEHPAHLYFKRAKSSELLFGDPSHHRHQLAHHIDI